MKQESGYRSSPATNTATDTPRDLRSLEHALHKPSPLRGALVTGRATYQTKGTDDFAPHRLALVLGDRELALITRAIVDKAKLTQAQSPSSRPTSAAPATRPLARTPAEQRIVRAWSEDVTLCIPTARNQRGDIECAPRPLKAILSVDRGSKLYDRHGNAPGSGTLSIASRSLAGVVVTYRRVVSYCAWPSIRCTSSSGRPRSTSCVARP